MCDGDLNAVHMAALGGSPQPPSPVQQPMAMAVTTMDDLMHENYWLREKLNEISVDRDRLLCEVANLRLELDMAELKRLPEDTFPQKVTDRPASAYTGLQSVSSGVGSGVGSALGASAVTGGYVYLQQQHYTPPPLQAGGGGGGGGGGNMQHQPQQTVYQCPSVMHSMGSSATQTLHKKGSVRNGGECLKRSRQQNGYELSQDLLEKQIELLERKYGGLRARNAAITIQRAFRHYTMVKKFASITAMAKAEKRMSRRVTASGHDFDESSSAYGSCLIDQQLSELQDGNTSTSQMQLSSQGSHPRVCATITATPPGVRATPVRSLSLRERRQLEATSPAAQQQRAAQSGAASPMPTSMHHNHPYVNLMHAEQHYYSTPTPQHFQREQYQPPTPMHLQYSQPSELSFDGSMNSSWGAVSSNSSPHTPYYTATQIYMRPRVVTPNQASAQQQLAMSKRVPPEVPKRTSSITQQQMAAARALRPNGLCKTAENGSLSSVQSSGSDSSAERIHCDGASDRSSSPQWKRKLNTSNSGSLAVVAQSPDHLGVVPGDPECHVSVTHTSAAQYSMEQHDQISAPASYKVSETIRKRQYRVGLNLFNKKPERGVAYLIRRGFLESTPQGVARFLISRKGLSRQMIGEYLGNLQNQFNMAVLDCFAGELDLSGMQVDVALRKFQAYFRMPGEAQKIERLMEVFSHRYCHCNSDIVARLRSHDTIFVMAFAIIMLNTDLHTPNLKPERRMRIDDFIKNLRGIDDCHDIDRDMLVGIYERVKANEFKPGSDHVTQVLKVQATIVGKKPNLALPHRRLVCYCRLYEIPDINKKERPGVHQREVFLFNDLLVITKIFSKKKSSVTYTLRNNFPLCGMVVTLLDVPNYPYCIRLSQKVDGKVLVTFNARNEHDRCKFAEDLRESISEMDEMEALRIEQELDRQKSARGGNRSNATSENRDSGVADVEVCPCPYQSPQGDGQGHHALHLEGGNGGNGAGAQLKRSALSNSLLDMHEQFGAEKPQRRGSVGSLDSGMSISFQSTSASTGSRNAPVGAPDAKMRLLPQHGNANGSLVAVAAGGMPATLHPHPVQPHQPHPGILGAIFQKRERKLSRSDEGAAAGAGSSVASANGSGAPYGRSTEV